MYALTGLHSLPLKGNSHPKPHNICRQNTSYEPMPGYTSIREDVLKKLQQHFPEIQQQFGIETLGIFGSVARGEDGPESDIDLFYRFRPDRIDYLLYLDLYDYLENLLGRTVDLIPLDNMPSSFRKYAEPDMIHPNLEHSTA